jgi:signal transduction histidine kinase
MLDQIAIVRSATFGDRLRAWFSRWSTSTTAMLTIGLTLCVGGLDYVTGPHISLSEFYLLPLAMAAWLVGVRFALAIAGLSVTLWFGSMVLGGQFDLANVNLLSWSLAQLISYVAVVILLTRLRLLQMHLEERVRERAQQLTTEIQERERLQLELLGISELEQRRIGQDLHDGLCQHLAGTALSCQALHEELAGSGFAEATSAQKIVELIEEGVVLSRQSAKGLHPANLDGEGLMVELEEFAHSTSRLFGVNCRFECDSPVFVSNIAAAENMYRIAQEAVRNAVKHSAAKTIRISLTTVEDGLELKIEDDGTGIPPRAAGKGMGLRIMPFRAHVIGANFSVRQREGGGTLIICKLPIDRETRQLEDEYSHVQG